MSIIKLPIEISTGAHYRDTCPVTFTADADIGAITGMLHTDTGLATTVQALAEGQAAFILNEAQPEQILHGDIEPAPAQLVMRIVEHDEGKLSILCGDALISEYRYGSGVVRPYFFPVNEPGGHCVTRSYPMMSVAQETSDHPHHRSLWIAHGDVGGVDNWSEEPGHGYTRHHTIVSMEQGPVVARFRTESLWCDAADRPILTQYLTATFWHSTGTANIMDFDVELANNVANESIVFGDTKEGGILSVRVASALDAARGGSISNVYGGHNEGECWGKHSHWCSYSGEIDGQPRGIAVFNHPDSFRAPTTWHVRNYGLMTANPFGYAAFTHGAVDGSHLLDPGCALKFRYRVIAQSEPGFDVKCSAHYLNYAFPPNVTIRREPLPESRTRRA